MRSVYVAPLAIGVFLWLSLQSLAQQRQPGATPVGSLTPGQQFAFSEGSLTFSKNFLLHDMGGLGDRIAQGRATGLEMRTQPLWGLRNTNRFMHDAATTSLEEAIRRHDGQGRPAREQFAELAADRVTELLTFLRSL